MMVLDSLHARYISNDFGVVKVLMASTYASSDTLSTLNVVQLQDQATGTGVTKKLAFCNQLKLELNYC